MLTYFLGGNINALQQMRNDGKSNQTPSHYLNVNQMQPNTVHFRGNSNIQSPMNEGSISNPNYKGNTISGDGTGNGWSGHNADVSKMYNYNSLAVNNNGNSIAPYPVSVIIKAGYQLCITIIYKVQTSITL